MNKELREELANTYDEEIIVFDNPEFDDAIIGVSTDNRVIYRYDLMIRQYMKDNKCSDIDAIEFIDYNTVRALSYMGGFAPIIMYDITDMF